MPSRTVIIIPTARLVEPALQVEFGKIPPVLLPFNGGVLLEKLLENYRETVQNPYFLLIGNEGIELIEEWLSLHPQKIPIELCRIPSVSSLGKTVQFGLANAKLHSCDQVIINFGDTLLEAQKEQLRGDVVFFQPVKEVFRWTTFTIDSFGSISSLLEKNQIEGLNERFSFVGVFCLSHGEQFLEKFPEVTQENSTIDSFYEALRQYVATTSCSFIRPKEWYDLGHLDNYHETRRKFLSTRYFNRVSVNERRGTLTKRSDNRQKLIQEIRWYLEIPQALQYFIPRIYDYSLEESDPWVEMEYYGYPSINDLWLQSSCEIGVWNHLFEALFFFLSECENHKPPPCLVSERESACQMYFTKTQERLSSLMEVSFLQDLALRSFTINGITLPSLYSMLPRLYEVIEERLVKAPVKMGVLHGDLCASNALFDPRGRVLKVLDPRGAFGKYSVYGDLRYDLAKLLHSFSGGYDHIVRNNFFLFIDNTEVSLSIPFSPYQEEVKKFFEYLLWERYGAYETEVRLIEALHFLTMIPLHKENLQRQIALLLIAHQKIARAII